MTNKEFVSVVVNIAKNHRTKYMWGTFGAPISSSLINQKVKQYPSRYSALRQKNLKDVMDDDYWAFDSVGLIKGVLWGWNGNPDKSFGGAVYCSNNVEDTTASGILRKCKGVNTKIDDNMPIGAIVYMTGHVGVYIGGGAVVECTLGDFGDGVVITKLTDRKWEKYGKLSYLSYKQECDIVVGSKVKLKPNAKIYGRTARFSSFVYQDIWVVYSINNKRAVIDKNIKRTKSICSPVHVDDLIPV